MLRRITTLVLVALAFAVVAPAFVAQIGLAGGAAYAQDPPAVLAGHVDSTSGSAVLYRLRELRRGDFIRVRRAGGSVVAFRVEGLERWPKARFPTRRVFGGTRIATLRLITCSGACDGATGHYLDHTIVYAVRVPERRRAA